MVGCVVLTVYACIILFIKWRVVGKHPLESAHESLRNNFVFFEIVIV